MSASKKESERRRSFSASQVKHSPPIGENNTSSNENNGDCLLCKKAFGPKSTTVVKCSSCHLPSHAGCIVNQFATSNSSASKPVIRVLCTSCFLSMHSVLLSFIVIFVVILFLSVFIDVRWRLKYLDSEEISQLETELNNCK